MIGFARGTIPRSYRRAQWDAKLKPEVQGMFDANFGFNGARKI
jgi:hypothetical protein